MKTIVKKIILNTICLTTILQFLNVPPISTFAQDSSSMASTLGNAAVEKNSYSQYIKNHRDKTVAADVIDIDINSYNEALGTEFKVGVGGLDVQSIITSDSGFVEYQIEVKSSALYSFEVTYYPIPGKGTAIEREIQIDGKSPFSEAKNIVFDRFWKDKTLPIINSGNEIRPVQIEIPTWQTVKIKDGSGYNANPLRFYLEKGPHKIRINSLRESMAIKSIKLYGDNALPVYSEVIRQYANLTETGDKNVFVRQGELSFRKSDPMLYPVCDRSSAFTQPESTSSIVLNTIGGVRWKLPGQWIEWQVEVPADGLYKISVRSRQNITNGLFSSRIMSVDGEIPFAEAANLHFNYSSEWQMNVFSNDNAPFLFHMKKGIHTIRLEATIGDMATGLETVEASLLTLNECYRKILMITGAVPDPFNDYDFETDIPEVLAELDRQADILHEVSLDLDHVLKQKGEQSALLEKLVRQIKEMVKKPSTIANRFQTFKSNIGSLGTWILQVREQPLEIDYITVSQPNYKEVKADGNIFDKLLHETKMFIAAFFSDYNSMGGESGFKGNLTVWTTQGRDQTQIIRQLADESFVEQNQIGVKMEMVSAAALLPSILAGKGPDAVMNLSSADVMNFSARGALINLSTFGDNNTIFDRFHQSALQQLSYNNGIYGLPEQQTFPMLFYRKDILQKSGLDVPVTWDDVYNIIAEIQKQNMEFGLPVGINSFGIFLYQNGGEFYKDNGKSTALDSEASVMAFRKWTEMFINYKLPMQYDFANRFRTGEMPIGIADYTMYNQLMVFAPEIKGLWGFAPVPGTVSKDGMINLYVPSTVGACSATSSAINKTNAWEYLKWWTNEQTQASFGRELESELGTAARYPTANKEALKSLPWRVNEIAMLEKQLQNVKAIPEVPGGYYTPRYIDFAFRKVVIHGENARENLLDYVKIINEEIKYKRKEFGLQAN